MTLHFYAGVFLEINGIFVPNFALLGHSEIGTSGDVEDVGSNLVCRTDNTSCCRVADTNTGRGAGNWYYPDGVRVTFGFETLPIGQIYHMLRGFQLIQLHRDDSANITAAANGIYHCEVADQDGVNQTSYVGLYSDGAGKCG